MRDACFASAELVGQLRQRVERVGIGVARRQTHAFERERDRLHARQFVAAHILRQPAFIELALRIYLARQIGWVQLRRDKAAADAIQLGLADGVRRTVEIDNGAVFFFDGFDELRAFALDQNLDTGAPFVVAAAVTVVGANDGFDVVEQLGPRQKFAHHSADHGRAAHAAADLHFEADFARGVFHSLQADVVPADGRAVFLGAVKGDFEFARQE